MHADASPARLVPRWIPATAAIAAMLCFVLVVAGLAVGLTTLPDACAAAPATPPIPAAFVPIFDGAAAQFELGASGWAELAAINAIESDFDDTALPGVASGANPFGAAGPMQIGIGGAAGDTWSRVAVAGVPGGVSPPSVYDEADAVYAAANLLHADGAPRDWAAALFAYNHAAWYVAEVSALAARYAAAGASSGGCAPGVAAGPADSAAPAVAATVPAILGDGVAAVPLDAPAPVQAMVAAGDRIIDQPYSWGGGHSPTAMGIPPDPASDPGAQENGAPGYDCSSAVAYLLWGAGLGQSLLGGAVPASQGLAGVGDPGPGRWVTIYAGTSAGQPHAFIEVDGIVLDTVHLEPVAPVGTGPRWQPLGDLVGELASGSFVQRHPPGL